MIPVHVAEYIFQQKRNNFVTTHDEGGKVLNSGWGGRGLRVRFQSIHSKQAELKQKKQNSK